MPEREQGKEQMEMAALMARLDERTQNMVDTMKRMEVAASAHKEATDKKLDDIMENHINPLKEQVSSNWWKTILIAMTGGAGGGIGIDKIIGLLIK